MVTKVFEFQSQSASLTEASGVSMRLILCAPCRANEQQPESSWEFKLRSVPGCTFSILTAFKLRGVGCFGGTDAILAWPNQTWRDSMICLAPDRAPGLFHCFYYCG